MKHLIEFRKDRCELFVSNPKSFNGRLTMKFRLALVAVAGFGALIVFDQAMASDLLNFGTTYTITGQGFTGTGSTTADFTDTVLLSPSTQTFDAGTLQITEATTRFAGGEFVEFYISTVAGPLVANGSTSDVTFGVNLSGIQLTAPAIFHPADFYFGFATNGVANTGISVGTTGLFPLFGVEHDPNPGSIGAGQNVFYCGSVFCDNAPYAPSTTAGYDLAFSPFYKFPYAFNSDPNANGFFLGFELTATPLPGALPMFAAGLGVIGLFARRKKRKNAISQPPDPNI
jgi:hypothetical protein